MSMLVPTVALCQEFEEQEEIERHMMRMELDERQMEMEQRKSEMDIDRRMQEMELEKHKIHLDRERRGPEHPGPGMHDMHGSKEDGHPLLLLIAVIHILVAIWVYTDIRQRNRGSGIWIVIALLAGLLGALVYAIVRLGDDRK
jgi:hypothetical protein